MSVPPFQPPWRNSMTMPPRGRNISSKALNKDPMSFSQRFSITYASEPDPLPLDRDLMENLEEGVVREIELTEVEDEDGTEPVAITDCKYIGSYNWMRLDNPAMLIPGSPPRWTSRATPYTVPPDNGMRFIDENGYRIPKYPLLPLILAVNKCSDGKGKAAFDWASADFVTDRSNLRKLVWWAQGISDRDFRIDMQLAGHKTILLSRWEKRTREPYSGRTYLASFERASTEFAPGCRDSGSHYRVVTYDLNGLKMVVRFEIDACLPPPAKYPRQSVSNAGETTRARNAVTLTPSLSVSQSEPRLTILEGGSEVSPASLVRINTRSANSVKNRPFEWKDAYMQLWLGQITHHVLAVYQRGRFVSVEKRKITTAAPEGEQPVLMKLRRVLDMVKEMATDHGAARRLSLVCVDGVLRVYNLGSGDSCLPESALRLFEDTC